MADQEFVKTGAYLVGLDRIADAWTVLILREAFFGARRFADFAGALQISRARLTERLKHLLGIGLLERRPCSATSQRQEYRLTQKGLETYPIALALIEWAQTWRAPENAPALVHTPCGHTLKPVTICRACGQNVRREDILWPPLIPVPHESPGGTVRRWRKMASFEDVSARPDPAVETLKAFGDRWSMLLMYGAQLGPFHFRKAQDALGLAPNILSDRLKHLVGEGLLERSGEGRLAAYQGTEAGLALYECILAIRTWAMAWEQPGPGGWAPVLHKPCGADLATQSVCAHCRGPADPGAVRHR